MIQHKCIQEDNIKELRKDVQGSKERDILQSEQIAMLKDGIGKIDVKVDKLDIKIDNLISTLDEKYAKKKSVDSWGMFYTMLHYKANEVLKVDRFAPTTKTCSNCGSKQSMKLSDRTFHCEVCGYKEDRDVNAAINILAMATD